MSRPGVDQKIFWSHVEKPAEPDGCWMWTGPNSKPTPTAAVYGKYRRTVSHRLAYELLRGPIPQGLELDHLCRVTLCCNPDHLEPVTRAENMRRRWAAQTHCKHGHELTPENCVGDSKACRACARKRRLAFYYAVERPALDVGRNERECRNGHARTEENTYITPGGHRQCRECRRGWQAADRKARRAPSLTRAVA